MKIENNVDLKKYTTFKMGGVAKKMYIPESEEDLIKLLTEKPQKYFIGGGSNLIINERTFDEIVNLRLFNKEIKSLGDGHFCVGASVRLQKLILFINNNGYGGIEYLFSVPGLVGGATVMNAGRGKSYNLNIGDFVEEVKVFYDGNIKWLSREECCFGYRSSILKNGDYIVLEVKYHFPKVDNDKSEKLRQERINLCKDKQDNSSPNFGTVFCESNKLIMQLFKYFPIGQGKGIGYSKKTANWMLNNGGSFSEAVEMVERVKKVHKIFKRKCRTEVIIWK